MSVDSLRKQVRQADAAYRAGAAVMSDAEFDALVEELRAVAPFAPELQQPGGGTALLSLDNCPLSDWWPGAPVVVQPKIDGLRLGCGTWAVSCAMRGPAAVAIAWRCCVSWCLRACL